MYSSGCYRLQLNISSSTTYCIIYTVSMEPSHPPTYTVLFVCFVFFSLSACSDLFRKSGTSV